MAEKEKWEDCKVVKGIEGVRFYIERCSNIQCYSRYIFEKNETRVEKTYAIVAGYMDGEYIDLFDLQEWFDENREWINSLKDGLKDEP